MKSNLPLKRKKLLDSNIISRFHNVIIFCIILIIVLLNSNIYAQCGSGTNKGSLTITTSWQNTAATGVSQLIYWSFTANSGETFNFSNCNGTAEDTYMRIYNSSWGQETFNDDYGPYCSGSTNASLDWTCTTGGTYYVWLAHYSCAALSNNQVLSYKKLEKTVPTSGSNSYTICSDHIYDAGGSGGAYSDNWDGSSVIYPSVAGNKIQISGTSSGEACCDWVKIYNGTSTAAPLLGTYYMNTAIPTLVSTDATGALTIQFHSDGSITGTGFDLTISCIVPCTPPSITTHPSNQTVCPSNNANFSVVASGSPTYQWQMSSDNASWVNVANGTPAGVTYTNGTSATMTANGTSAVALYYYRCVVTQGCSSNSNSATLTINPPIPATPGVISGIATQCPSLTGQTYSISAVANATTYTWNVPAGWSITAGAGTTSITVTTGSAGQNGNITVSAGNSCGTSAVRTKAVTVGSNSVAPTGINATSNPICSGNSTNLSVVGGSLGSGAVWKWGYNACGSVFNQGWSTQPYGLVNTTQNFVNGVLNVTSTSNDPMIDMASLGSFDPTIYKYIQIRYRVLSGTAGNAEIFFYNTAHNYAVGGESATGALVSDGSWHVVNINMASDPDYATGGNIQGWRFDWSSANAVTMEFDYISLTAVQGSPVTVSPTSTATYYVYAEGDCNITSCASLAVTVVSVPTAIAATGQTGTQFTANWNAVAGATGYYLDVATDAGFTSMVAGYNNLNVGNVTSKNVTGLSSGITYYYRVRAYSGCGTTSSSNTISVCTLKYLFTVDDSGGQEFTSISAALASVYSIWGSIAFDAHVVVDVYSGTYSEQVIPNTNLNPTSTSATLTIRNHDGESPVINATGNAYGFYLNNFDFTRILGFTVYGATTANIYVVGSQNEIGYNKCYNSSAGSGIRLENSTTQSGIHHNLCYANFIHGVHLKNCTNTIVKNNTCYSNGNIGAGASGNLTPSFSGSVAINDGTCDVNFAEASIAVAQAYVVTDVNVTVSNLTHTYDGDIKIYLQHPDGTNVLLSDRRGGGSDNYSNTVFDDEAGTAISAGTAPFTGSFRPEAVLSALDGKTTSGTWKLRVTDCAGGDVGTISSWSLNIAYTIPASSNSGAGLYVESGAGSIVTNNILVAKSAAGDYFYGMFSVPAIAATSGFNTYYANGNTYFVKHNATSYNNLATWNGTAQGNSDLNGDPLFVTVGSDFHIKSMAGSYAGGLWPPSNYLGGTWTYDGADSPCIDKGDASGVASEPSPNGGVINQGAYGGTTHASKSTLPPTITAVGGGGAVTIYKDRGKQVTIQGTSLVNPSATLGGIAGSLVSYNITSAVFNFPPANYPNNNLIVTNSAGSSAVDNTNITLATRNIIPVKQTGAVDDDHPTITSAVNGLKAWWGTAAFDATKVISVYDGTYTEGLDVDYNFNTGSYRLVFQGTTGRPIINASSQSVGLYVHNGASAVNNVTIKGFKVMNALTGGIGIIGGNDSIYNNIVYDCGTYNIYHAGASTSSLISQNKCYNTSTVKWGIAVSGTSNVLISNNLCYGHKEHGIYLDAGANNNCTIINNTCYNNGSSSTSGGSSGTLAPSSGAISVAIPDVGCPTLTQNVINVATVANITDVNVKVNITHTWDGDLKLYLKHPDGTQVNLCLNRGGSGDNFANTWFDDEAGTAISAGTAPFTGSFIPDGPLSAFDNKPTNGAWTLQVCDGAGGDLGTITQWELFISYTTGGGTTYTGTGCYIAGGTNALLKNNIFVAKSGTGDQYYAMRADVSISTSSGYNNYFKNGNTNFIKHTSTNYSDSATWNATTVGNSDWVANPLFVNTSSGTEDFHIKSNAVSSTYAGGEWPPFIESGGSWTSYSGFYSPAIDAGDPASSYSNEQSFNGSRINQGCYGNTVQATKSCLITAANAGPDQNPACPNPTITLAGNTPVYGSGTWSVIGGAGTFTQNTVPTTTVSSLNNGANTYRWTITNNGCTSVDDVLINNQMPSPSASAGPDQLILSGTTSNLLAANTPTQGTGTWTVIQGTVSSFTPNANSPTATANGLAPGLNILQWNIATAGCPSNPTFDQVEILVAPSHTGLFVTGNFTNSGTFTMTNDDQYTLMIGNSKSVLGTNGLYTNAKLKMNSLGATPKIFFNATTMSGNPVVWVSDNTLEISTGKTLKCSSMLVDASKTLNLTASSNIECTGNWTNNGNVTMNANANVKFLGTSQQTIVAGSSTYTNVVFNNTTNSGTWDIKTNKMKISTTGTFTSGIIEYTAGTDTLVFLDGATVTPSASSTNGFVNGPVQKRGTNAFIFPTGDVQATNKVSAPIGIAASAYAVFTAGYSYLAAPNPTNLDVNINHVSMVEYWNLNRDLGAGAPDVTLYWKDGVRSGITDITTGVNQDLYVAHYNVAAPNKWQNMGGTIAGTLASGSITSTVAFPNYSPITFGSKTGKNPLPIDLLSFTAVCNGVNVVIDWSTTSETNCNYFQIEKSFDAIQWFEVAKVSANGNSNQMEQYQFLDQVDFLNKAIYYRLVEVDFDGEVTYFQNVSTSCEGQNASVSYSIYPNPAKDALSISIQSATQIKGAFVVTNELGQKIDLTDIFVEKGNNEFMLNTSSYSSGVYYISIISDNFVYPVKRFVISR